MPYLPTHATSKFSCSVARDCPFPTVTVSTSIFLQLMFVLEFCTQVCRLLLASTAPWASWKVARRAASKMAQSIGFICMVLSGLRAASGLAQGEPALCRRA